MIASGLRGPWVPQVPAGGWAVSPALVAAPPPELGREGGRADQGSGRSWPRPTPGDPQHPFPALHPGCGGPRPRPARPPHSLAFPGRGLCSSLCAVPTSSAFTACTSSCSFPMAPPGPQRRGARCSRRFRRSGGPASAIASSPARAACAARRPAPSAGSGSGSDSGSGWGFGLGLGLGLRRGGTDSASRAGGGPGAGADDGGGHPVARRV